MIIHVFWFSFLGQNSSFVKNALHSLQNKSDTQNMSSSPEHQKEEGSASLSLHLNLTI